MKSPHFSPARPAHVYNAVLGPDDPIVQNGLALTPARMLELNNQGFSISSQNARQLSAVAPDAFNHMDVPLEFTRGFDIADGYQKSMEVHNKIRNFVNMHRNTRRSTARKEE